MIQLLRGSSGDATTISPFFKFESVFKNRNGPSSQDFIRLTLDAKRHRSPGFVGNRPLAEPSLFVAKMGIICYEMIQQDGISSMPIPTLS
jgi:hypothetical protein